MHSNSIALCRPVSDTRLRATALASTIVIIDRPMYRYILYGVDQAEDRLVCYIIYINHPDPLGPCLGDIMETTALFCEVHIHAISLHMCICNCVQIAEYLISVLVGLALKFS